VLDGRAENEMIGVLAAALSAKAQDRQAQASASAS
jgi:hypothetical protein